MTRVLVIGAGGMAGHVVTRHLIETGDFEVQSVTARNRVEADTQLLDVTNTEAFRQYLNSNQFDVVINCIGALVQASEQHKELAVYLNSYLPHMLEKRFESTGTKLIHLSTDCVFSGFSGPYREDSFPDGESFYDRSKALGEVVNEKDLTFRMSILGPDSQTHGVGLFNWFFAQTGEISGYTKAIWNGVTTITLARAIEAAIRQDLKGLYHLVPDTNISKYELLQLFKAEFSREDISVSPDGRSMPDKTLINTREDFEYEMPSYPEQIAELRRWVDRHPDLYPHYKRDSTA